LPATLAVVNGVTIATRDIEKALLCFLCLFVA